MDSEQKQPENPTKPRTETLKIDGVSAQINLSPGSETHRRFARIMRETGILTARALVDYLIDAYENPQATDTDNSEIIANLEQKVKDLTNENTAYEATVLNYEQEIDRLKLDLAEARNDANNNATKALSIEQAHQGAIVIKPNPVVAYFLNEMSEKTGKPVADILQALYIADLQNPRANNLPYTVTSDRIREVMRQLKPNQP